MKSNPFFIGSFLLLFFSVLNLKAKKQDPLRYSEYREKVWNLPEIDRRKFSFGYSMGLVTLGYKINQRNNTEEIYAEPSVGYYACIRVNYGWRKYLDIRTGIGFTQVARTIVFSGLSGSDAKRTKNSNMLELPVYFKLHTERERNIRPYILAGGALVYDLGSNEDKSIDNFGKIFRTKTLSYQFRMGVGIDLYFKEFKLSPSIIKVISLSNELVPDGTSPSPWTDNIENLYTQGFIFSLTFQ